MLAKVHNHSLDLENFMSEEAGCYYRWQEQAREKDERGCDKGKKPSKGKRRFVLFPVFSLNFTELARTKV